MSLSSRWIIAVALTAISCAAQKAGDPPPSFDPTLATALDAAVAQHLEAAAVPGASVAVLRGDGTMHIATAGKATLDPPRAVAPDDRFRIGSITKTFVSTVIQQLDEEGALSIDDAVNHWLPQFNLDDAVTLRRCLSHTSGVYNFTDDPAFLSRSGTETAPEEVINFALSHGSVFEPGTGYSYSNTNYFILGMIIEKVTGKRLADVLQQRLFTPLGFTDTWMEGSAPNAVPSVTGYLLGSDPGPYNASWAWAAGGMNSSTGTLCHWAKTLFAGEGAVLPVERVNAMIAPTELTDHRTVEYGLGIDRVQRNGHLAIGHTGSTMGFKGEVFFDPSNGNCVAVLTNDFFGTPKEISEAVWEVLDAYGQ